MLPKIISLISIVALQAWMIYLIMGCLPLLILKHDDPSDSQLIRGFFDVHYRVLMGIAAVGTLSSAFSDRRLLAMAFACIALSGLAARRVIVARMDRLRGSMSATDVASIRTFRRLHVTGIGLDILLLVGFISALSLSSADILSCVETPPGCRGDACRVQCSLLQ